MPPVDVTVDRNLWLGGSDMINVFKSKNAMVELAYGKAFPNDKSFSNKYTEYGHLMEPQIREVMEKEFSCSFQEESFYNYELMIRGNLDGFNHDKPLILEIKTSVSNKSFYDCLHLYKYQLLTYSYLSSKADVVLAVMFHDGEEFHPLIDITKHEIEHDHYTYDDLLDFCGLTTETFEDGIYDFWDEVSKQEELGEQVVEIPSLHNLLEEYNKAKDASDVLKVHMDQLKENINEILEANKTNKYAYGNTSIVRVEPTTKKTFDKSLLLEDYPDLDINDESYYKVSTVKGSVKITTKKEKK